jgi:hypothetical protein
MNSSKKTKEIKKGHYVPQFYLKKFTHDDYRLFVFDKFAKKSFPSNVRDIANEKYFYDLPEDFEDENIDPQLIEKALGVFEGDFSEWVDDALRSIKDKKRIDHKQKTHLSLFMVIQLLRTREARNFQIEMVEKLSKALLDFAIQQERPDISPEDYQIKFDPKMASLLQAKQIFDLERIVSFAGELYKHIWLIGKNKTKQPFYTSDNPVVKYAHKRTLGIASEGIELAFPLTPEWVLILRERSFFREFESLDCRVIPLSDGNVTYYNSLQVIDSYRQLYCSTNNFNLAKEMCDENPEICNLDRVRIVG